jgi:hypothetical protein
MEPQHPGQRLLDLIVEELDRNPPLLQLGKTLHNQHQTGQASQHSVLTNPTLNRIANDALNRAVAQVIREGEANASWHDEPSPIANSNPSPQGQPSISPPRIISREQWGAKPPRLGPGRLFDEINIPLDEYYHTIIIHHAGNEFTYPTVNQIQEKHFKENKADIGYHFAIDRYGNIFEGRPIGIAGAHVSNANTGLIGIVLLADLDTKDSGLVWYKSMFEWFDDELTPQMKQSALHLVLYLKQEYGIEYLGGHQDVNCTRPCPGDVGEAFVEQLQLLTKTATPWHD